MFKNCVITAQYWEYVHWPEVSLWQKQIDRQTDRHRHCDSMSELAQWGDAVKSILFHSLSSSFILFHPLSSVIVLLYSCRHVCYCLFGEMMNHPKGWYQGQGFAFQRKAIAKHNQKKKHLIFLLPVHSQMSKHFRQFFKNPKPKVMTSFFFSNHLYFTTPSDLSPWTLWRKSQKTYNIVEEPYFFKLNLTFFPKGEVVNTIMNTKGKTIVPPFWIFNRHTGVIWLL